MTFGCPILKRDLFAGRAALSAPTSGPTSIGTESGPTSDGVSDRARSRNESADRALISGSSFVEWERPFDQPVPLPNGPPAQTLRDAANYTKRLPDSDRDRPECRLPIRMLIDAAEDSVRKSASSD